MSDHDGVEQVITMAWRTHQRDSGDPASTFGHPAGLAPVRWRATRPRPVGVEFQVRCDCEWFYGRRWPTRELALAEAEEWKADSHELEDLHIAGHVATS